MSSNTRTSSAASASRPTCADVISAPSWTRSRMPSRRSSSTWILSGAGRRVRRAASGPEELALRVDRRRDRGVPAPSDLLPEPSAGDAVLLDLALGAGGRRAGGLLG